MRERGKKCDSERISVSVSTNEQEPSELEIRVRETDEINKWMY